jgi:hypothetical protein
MPVAAFSVAGFEMSSGRLCSAMLLFGYELERNWICNSDGGGGGIVPRSVELCEASAAVNDVKRPSRFEQQRDCLFPFRSEQQARLVRVRPETLSRIAQLS